MQCNPKFISVVSTGTACVSTDVNILTLLLRASCLNTAGEPEEQRTEQQEGGLMTDVLTKEYNLMRVKNSNVCLFQVCDDN